MRRDSRHDPAVGPELTANIAERPRGFDVGFKPGAA